MVKYLQIVCSWFGLCFSLQLVIALLSLTHSLYCKYVWWIMGHILNGKHIFQNSFSTRRREKKRSKLRNLAPENIISPTSRATAVFPGEFFLTMYIRTKIFERLSPCQNGLRVPWYLPSTSDPCPSIMCMGQMTLLSGIKMPIERI